MTKKTWIVIAILAIVAIVCFYYGCNCGETDMVPIGSTDSLNSELPMDPDPLLSTTVDSTTIEPTEVPTGDTTVVNLDIDE